MRGLIFIVLFVIAFCFYGSSLVAQEKRTDSLTVVKSDPIIYPRFQGNLIKWIYSHLDYPREAWIKGEEGVVYVSFNVRQDGTISKVEIRQKGFPVLDHAAKTLIESMPVWSPGKQSGEQKDFSYTVPIIFSLKAIEPLQVENYDTYISDLVRLQNPQRVVKENDLNSMLLFEKYLNMMYGYNNRTVYKAIYKGTKTKQQTTELLLGATLPSLNFSDEDESFILNEYKKEWDEQIRLIDSIPDESFIKSYVKLIDRLYYNKICREVKLREYLGERKFKQYVEGCVLYSGQLVLNTSKNVLVGKWELIQRNDERPVAPVYKSFYSNYRFEDSNGNAGTYKFERGNCYYEDCNVTMSGNVVDYEVEYRYSLNGLILVLTGEMRQTLTDGSVKVSRIRETWKRLE